MYPVPEFENFYNSKIIPALTSAEKVRRKILLNYSIIGTVALAGFVFEAMTWMLIGVAVIILFVVLYTNWYHIPSSRFERLYEDSITDEILHTMPGKLRVDRNRHLSLNELRNSLILSSQPQYFGGSYLISGDVEGFPLRISEIQSSTKRMHKDGIEKIHDDINGLVALMHVQVPITSSVVICSGNQIDAELEGITNRIQIESEPGELLFYAEDESMLKRFLPTPVLEHIRTYLSETGNEILLTLTHDGIAMAIIQRGGHRYLKPSVFRSVFSKMPIRNYYRDLHFTASTLLMAANHVSAISV